MNGPVAYWEYDKSSITPKIRVQPYPNAAKNTSITVKVTSRNLLGGENGQTGSCQDSTVLMCEECECKGAGVIVFKSISEADAVDKGNSVSLWADSGGEACPPYTWTVQGNDQQNDWHFGSVSGPKTAITENDLDQVSLFPGPSVCGAATVTVTDDCGESDTTEIRCSVGTWSPTREQIIGVWDANCEGFHEVELAWECGQNMTLEVIEGKWRYSVEIGDESGGENGYMYAAACMVPDPSVGTRVWMHIYSTCDGPPLYPTPSYTPYNWPGLAPSCTYEGEPSVCLVNAVNTSEWICE